MANQFQTLNAGAAELKNYYQGPIIDLLNEEVPVYRACEKIKEGWSGAQVVRPLRTARNQGVGATSDGGNLPKIGRQTTVQAQISSAFNYARFGITGPMIKASQSSAGSFVRSAQYELEMAYNDLKTELSRQLSWDGTGTLATVNTSSIASNSLVIFGRTASEPALKYIDVGTTFDVVDGSQVIVATGVTVTAISSGTAISATATLTLDQAITTTSTTNFLIRSGSNNQEMKGLLYSLDGGTTTIYNVNRSTSIGYQGNLTDLTNAANPVLSIDAMQTPFNEGLRRGGIGSYSAVWCDFTSLRYYQKLLTPDKRYSNTQEGDGSFGSKGKFYMDFNGIPVVPDKDSSTTFLFLPAEVLKMYVLCEAEFADETGSMYIAQSDVDALEVRIRHFTQLFPEQPAAMARLKGYTSP